MSESEHVTPNSTEPATGTPVDTPGESPAATPDPRARVWRP